MTTTTTIPTRRAERSRLEAIGIEGPAAEFLLAAGAAARHAARVDAAYDAAYAAAYAAVEDADAPATRRAAALRLFVLELVGEGGHLALGALGGGDFATARIPPFSTLGKGRRQATDGGAWEVAIREAFERLRGSERLTLDVVEGRPILEGEGWSILLPEGAEKGAERTLTLIRAALVAVTRESNAAVDGVPIAPLIQVGDTWIQVKGTARGWGAAFNAALAARVA